MTESLSERVRAAVAATLNLPLSAVGPDTSADNNGAWDSLAQVNIVLAIEQTFAVELDVEDFTRLTSVAKIVEYIEAQGGA